MPLHACGIRTTEDANNLHKHAGGGIGTEV